MREKIARTDLRTEQTVHLATDVKADTSEIRADTRKIKEDGTISRCGIGRVEASHSALIKMIRKMEENMETLLQENSRNKECKNHPYTRFLMTWQHVNLGRCTLALYT